MNRIRIIWLFLFIPVAGLLAQVPGGQNNTCETAFAFCTGTLYEFPAGVNAGSGQSGPCYSCLSTRPNPAWYYMKVLTPGNIIIYMHSDPLKDIDFCCWGPFSSQDCCDSLVCNKVVDCSYSPAPQETCVIPNGLTGQYYMLVITNFSNEPCNIIFEQTGGSGTTDCTILPPAASSNSPVCAGQTLQLAAQSVSGASYHWSGPAGFTSNLQNPAIPNATPANSGNYYLNITVNGQPSADSSLTVAWVYEPFANAGNDTTVNNGVYANLTGACTGGSGSYHYHWEPAALFVDPDVRKPQTVNLFSTTIFTLTVTDDSASCQASDLVTVNVVGGVLAVNAVAMPGSICAGTTTQLQAVGSGGAGNYTYSWTGPNGFTSGLQDPTVQPPATSTYSVTVSDGYNTATNTVTVTVIPLPVADAGLDKSIPNGTYTFLSGSVPGGNSYYFYAWSPSDKLINANVQYPQTVNLTTTTTYSLIVTDLATNCVSNNAANVMIEVTGGPLNTNPVATPDQICSGDTTQLHAGAGGGNVGFYTYQWASVPPGFSDTSANPYVHPTVNTSYSVTVFDGFNYTSGNTLVSIYPQPQVVLGPPDSTVCIYDTVTLDAGNPGATYLWSNGATTRTIEVLSSGIGFESQHYDVSVTNQYGCTTVSSINVIFSFAGCTGIHEAGGGVRIIMYPNPSDGTLQVTATGFDREINAVVMDLAGRTVARFVVPGEGTGSRSTEVDLPDLAPGIYVVRFDTPEYSQTQKLIIE
jgi:hypothetical protein